MADSATNNLEHQLRGMILNNVTLSDSHSTPVVPSGDPNQHQGPGRGHGRGRARGGYHRGRGARTGENNVGQIGHPLGNAVPSPSEPREGRGRGGRGRRNGPVGPRGNNHSSTRPQASDPSSTGGNPRIIPDQYHDRGSPGSRMDGTPPTQNGVGGTGGPVHQPPRILSRPANASAPPYANNRAPRPPGTLNSPRQPKPRYIQENPMAQIEHLDHLASEEIPKAEIAPAELEEKEAFRRELESVLQKALTENYSGDDIANINLVGFGSLASGFATAGSDVDLALVPSWKDSNRPSNSSIALEIPRILEKAVLDVDMGGRLLTRTRVPILKVCQLPTEPLAQALLEERKKWDDLPEEEKYALPTPPEKPVQAAGVNSSNAQPVPQPEDFPALSTTQKDTKKSTEEPKPEDNINKSSKEPLTGNAKEQQPRANKTLRREKTLGPLDFPKTGVGIQCDINFENPLGIHNTRLLRCYSLCDPRVRLMVLFVKAWAKRRKINSSYSGTLSSYGWVLMVLHYLVNVAQPPVCPNLQALWRPPLHLDAQSLQRMFEDTVIAGYTVRFYDNEPDIMRAAQAGQLTMNTQSIGALLRGFFQYYSSVPQPYGPRQPTFYWTNEVLSLRTLGGIRTKSDKNWTGAKTTVSNGKEVRHRYLFCIEDPFELDHNVARTVTHFGIVAIRDEFRRAWRILSAIGRGIKPEGGLFDEILEPDTPTQEEKAGVADREGGTLPHDDAVDKVDAVQQQDSATPTAA